MWRAERGGENTDDVFCSTLGKMRKLWATDGHSLVPAVYKVVNKAMFNPDRRVTGSEISAELKACCPYIRFLDEALSRLPDRFVYHGRVQRGIKHVFPSLTEHDP